MREDQSNHSSIKNRIASICDAIASRLAEGESKPIESLLTEDADVPQAILILELLKREFENAEFSAVTNDRLFQISRDRFASDKDVVHETITTEEYRRAEEE